MGGRYRTGVSRGQRAGSTRTAPQSGLPLPAGVQRMLADFSTGGQRRYERMPVFLTYTALGTGLWSLLLTALG